MTITSPSHTLTDAQSLALSAASQRSDGRLILPEHLHGMAAQRLVRSLVRRGLVVALADEAPRHDPGNEPGLTAYCITPAGLAATGIMPDDTGQEHAASGAITAESDGNALSGVPEPGAEQRGAGATRAPRLGTKSALVLALLSGEGGATLGAITAATGWLPHTTRAALTGLRQRGYAVERTPGPDGVSRYRLAQGSTGEAV